MASSILETVKKSLGLPADYDAFDPDILLFTNSVLANLNQIGVGPTAGFQIEEITEYVSDFRVQNKKWGDAYKKHYKEIIKEQGRENTDYHIEYFDTYLRLIDEGKAANHLFISKKP